MCAFTLVPSDPTLAPSATLPLPALRPQIVGPIAGVRTAARGLIDRVRDGVQRDNQPSSSTLAIAHTGRGALPPPGGAPMMPDGQQVYAQPPVAAPNVPQTPPIYTQYKLLVPDARVGSIIGKGGDVSVTGEGPRWQGRRR